MEKRRFMKDNKGYTLIEMIIVIAIIAIMTGAAMVTITICIMQKPRKLLLHWKQHCLKHRKMPKGKCVW